MVLQKSEGEQESSGKKVVVMVVEKLPVQEVRTVETEKEIINYVTISEYLTEQANARIK